MSKEFNQKTLSLFNAVLSKNSNSPAVFLHEHGVVVNSQSVWAVDDITSHLKSLSLSGVELNKTFHKSWLKVQSSTSMELSIEQISHYLSTYGSDFEGTIYLPSEVLSIPDLNLVLKSIGSLSEFEIISKSLSLLQSGIALKENTLKDVFFVLNFLDYKFNGSEAIKNKEAIILIADKFSIYPENPEEFLRYLVWHCTESTLLIKSQDLCLQISNSNKNVSKKIEAFGIEKMASIFNRFKPLFLAMRKSSTSNKVVINKLSKLSKSLHTPMVQNALNLATQKELTKDDIHWLDNATPYALFKALEACYNRKEGQTSFAYRIRNGKSWVKRSTPNVNICTSNYDFIKDYLVENYNGNGKKVFIPSHIAYAVPTSEKMMVGNVPMGTKFFGESLAAGVYWEDKWGASDIDISGVSVGGNKIGWNSSYTNDNNSVSYSGDITSAPDGAVEYLWAKGDFQPTIVMSNVYSGDDNSGYKIIIGQGDDVSKDYMMNPNNVLVEIKTNSVQSQTILGFLLNEGSNQSSFTLFNVGAGSLAVSGSNYMSTVTNEALSQTMTNDFNLIFLLKLLNYDIVLCDDESAINLEVHNLTKNSFIDLFKKS